MNPKKSNAVAAGRKQTAPALSAATPSATLAANQAPDAADPPAAGPREPKRKQKRKPEPEPEARTEPEAPPQPSVAELAAISAGQAAQANPPSELKGLPRLLAAAKTQPEAREWEARRQAALDAIQWPSPKDYPIRADRLAGLAVPRLKGRTADAAKAIKKWLVWCEALKGYKRPKPIIRQTKGEIFTEVVVPNPLFNAEPDESKVAELFWGWNIRKLSMLEFKAEAESFAVWYAWDHPAEVSAIRRQAGRQGGRPKKKG